MVQRKSKTEVSTEAAYAEAAAKVPTKSPAKPAPRRVVAKKPAAKVAVPAVEADAVPAFVAPAADATPEPAAIVASAEPVEPVSAPEAISPATIEPPVDVAPTPAKTPMITLKDISMTTDFTATISDAANEVQAKFQAAFDKSTAMVTEMTDLAKGNVEAVVESGKLFAAGVQDLGKSYADEAKSAYETATADLKEMAAIKSPTELFQLQGKILRRNFDMFVAATSKSTDAALKLANEAMAPISGRVNVAADKLSKVAA